jgi:hypothetical protein
MAMLVRGDVEVTGVWAFLWACDVAPARCAVARTMCFAATAQRLVLLLTG